MPQGGKFVTAQSYYDLRQLQRVQASLMMDYVVIDFLRINHAIEFFLYWIADDIKLGLTCRSCIFTSKIFFVTIWSIRIDSLPVHIFFPIRYAKTKNNNEFMAVEMINLPIVVHNYF